MDTLGCGLLALAYPACVKLLGPVVPGATLPAAARACPARAMNWNPCKPPSTSVRWCAGWTSNDTWLAAEWGHPSDNLGGILAVADYLSRAGSRSRSATVADRDDSGARNPRRARA